MEAIYAASFVDSVFSDSKNVCAAESETDQKLTVLIVHEAAFHLYASVINL